MTGLPFSADVTALIGDQDFVRRLARSIVFDRDRVDDVVQEAWLASLQNPPLERAAVASWFRRVLSNLAARRARDEARRRERERAVTRPEALPSTADVLAREQTRREVVEAVLALPEPYRGAVLARWFDDLEPAEIARRRGLPPATVRSQCQRGLEMLRERLAARHGDTRQWSLAMLALAQPPKATGLAIPSIAGGLLMAKLWWSLSALLLLALSFWWFLEAPSLPPPPAKVERAIVDAAAPAIVPAAPRDAPPRETERTTLAVAAAPAHANGESGLRGRVVRADGSGVAAALVRAIGFDGTSLFLGADAGHSGALALERGEARTRDDGTFSIEGLAARSRYVLNADADGDDRTVQMVDSTPMPGEVLDVGDVRLQTKGRVRGRAVDDSGAPVQGAEVLALDLPALVTAALPIDRFDPRHGAMLSVPLPSTGTDLAALAKSLRRYLGSELFLQTLDERDRFATCVVDRLPWVEEVWRDLPFARATTGADGAFELRGVVPGDNMLVVRSAGRASSVRPRIVVREGQSYDAGEVLLGVGETLAGIVCGSDGEPAPGAEVRVASIGLLGHRGLAFTAAPVVAGADGRFAVGGLPRGRALVAARTAGRPWHTIGPVEIDDDVTLTLPASSALVLRVHRADEREPGVMQIAVHAGPLLGELRRVGLQERVPVPQNLVADENGIVRVATVPDGWHVVTVTAAGASPAEILVQLPSDGPVAVELAAAAPHTFRVHDDAGQPIRGAAVYLARRDASAHVVMPTDYGLGRFDPLPTSVGSTDERGELAIEAAPADGFVATAIHPHHGPAKTQCPPGRAETTLVLARCGSLTGAMFDHGVRAPAGRYSLEARPVDGFDAPPLAPQFAAIQQDGSFRFPALAPGKWQVRARERTGPLTLQSIVQGIRERAVLGGSASKSLPQEVEIAPAAATALRFDLDPDQPLPGEVPARIRGRVTEDGAPLASAVLQRQQSAWTFVPVTSLGADGTFRVDAIRPGTHRLQLARDRAASQVVWEGDVVLADGTETVLDLAFTTRRLRGTVAFVPGLPTAGYWVSASGRCNGGTTSRTCVVAADGSFAFERLPVGDYDLECRGPDCHGSLRNVKLADETSPVRIELQELLVVSGRVDTTGLDLSRTVIYLRAGDQSISYGKELEADGSFAFRGMKPQQYELLVVEGRRTFRLEPGRFDLRDGSRRDLVLRAIEDPTAR